MLTIRLDSTRIDRFVCPCSRPVLSEVDSLAGYDKGIIHQPCSFLKRLCEKQRGHEKGNIHQPCSFLKRLRERERGHEKGNIHQPCSFLKSLREKERVHEKDNIYINLPRS